jgi:hypothetical protein
VEQAKAEVAKVVVTAVEMGAAGREAATEAEATVEVAMVEEKGAAMAVAMAVAKEVARVAGSAEAMRPAAPESPRSGWRIQRQRAAVPRRLRPACSARHRPAAHGTAACSHLWWRTSAARVKGSR